MKIDLKSIPVQVINLKENEERMDRTWDELRKFYPGTFGFSVVEGIRENPPYVGIAKAHLNAIRNAKESDWDYVCVCEDDVHFQSTKSFEYAQWCMDEAPDDFDILLSGVYSLKSHQSYSDRWTRVGSFSGTHFYIVKASAYDKILEFDCSKNIDRWYGVNLNCYVTKKWFAIQHDGWSDNAQKVTDYSNLLTKFDVLK